MAQRRVLVVEGDEAVRQLVSQTLRQKGYEVLEASNAEDGIKAMRPAKSGRAIDVVLCNRQVPSQNGQDPLIQFLAQRPAVPVVMVTDHPDLHYATQMFRQGVSDYLVKPIQTNALIDVVRHAIERGQGHPRA